MTRWYVVGTCAGAGQSLSFPAEGGAAVLAFHAGLPLI